MYKLVLAIGLLVLTLGCEPKVQNNRNLHFRMENLIERHFLSHSHMETVYVPIYTDVYHIDQSKLFPLTVTLSLRNTSLTDTINIYTVNYYNSEGNQIKQHIKESFMLQLKPLESYELVIDKMTYSGDTGANFIIEYSSPENLSPLLVQALMINTSGQQGLSFITEGKIIKSKSIKP